MSVPQGSVNTGRESWVQMPLFPPEVVEIRLSVGVVQSVDHVQFQIEVWDASGETLIGMRSHPGVLSDHVPDVLEQYFKWLRHALRVAREPFLDDVEPL